MKNLQEKTMIKKAAGFINQYRIKVLNIIVIIYKYIKRLFLKCKNGITWFFKFVKPKALKFKKVCIIVFKPVWTFIINILKFFVRIIKKFKPLLFILNIIFALYITIIVIIPNAGKFIPDYKLLIIFGLLLTFIIYIITKLFYLECDIKIHRNKERVMFSWKTVFVFTVVAFILYVLFMINFIAHFPGGISTDNVDQWKQVQSNIYDNLHPAIHSMMIWVITRIVNNYTFVIKVQIFCFSLMAGYLAATLVSWGIRIQWIIIFVFFLISPRTTFNILLFAWKDNAFTIFLMCLTAYMINIVMSDGLWLKKWYNIIGFSIVFALASLIRHNGILFTIPVLIFIIFFIKKAKIFTIITIITSLLVIYGITNGLYKKVNVEQLEGHTYYETIGLPMTILGGVLVNKPEVLNDETKEFLFKITSEQQWRRNFRTGNYNSVKWLVYNHQKDVIKEIPPKDLLNMTLEAIKNAPAEALTEFIGLTRYVWDPFYWDGEITYWNNGSQLGVMYTQAEVNAMRPIKEKYEVINNRIKDILELISPNRLLTSFGLHMLLLLIFGYYSLNRNLGYKSLLLLIPSITYNLGTMLIISGPEWRFFHFNTVITLPLIIALLAREKEVAPADDTKTIIFIQNKNNHIAKIYRLLRKRKYRI
jgi:hypothetical protein